MDTNTSWALAMRISVLDLLAGTCVLTPDTGILFTKSSNQSMSSVSEAEIGLRLCPRLCPRMHMHTHGSCLLEAFR